MRQVHVSYGENSMWMHAASCRVHVLNFLTEFRDRSLITAWGGGVGKLDMRMHQIYRFPPTQIVQHFGFPPTRIRGKFGFPPNKGVRIGIYQSCSVYTVILKR